MKCSYCHLDAVIAGEAPVGTGGLKELWACDRHAHRIQSLNFTTLPAAELELKKRREQKIAERDKR